MGVPCNRFIGRDKVSKLLEHSLGSNQKMENHTIAAVCLSAILSLAIFGMVVRFLFVRRTRKTEEKNDQEDMESQSQISENDLVILQNLFLECEHRVPIHAVAANVPPPDYVEKTCTFSQACYSLSSSPPSYMDAFENVNKSLSLREKVLTPVFDSEDDEDAKSNSDMSLN
ncbi:hypothetical protein L596_006815 [Steinernema carpocapsae]|uniref:Uncharacterized protein n=1 Tax=Steinernema carpocapsae TaxID=34508 RepID=A0A4U5P6Z4_STECR|nr:hypothetical protein L596_006815 [Steinernema carpocapsae]